MRRLTDVTEEWGTLSLMGPNARAMSRRGDRRRMSRTRRFPFGHVREIDIAGHAVRALRVTYVGELGWELHMPIGRDRRCLRCADGGGRAAWHCARRLPRARIAAAREGLSRLGLGHHAQRQSLRGGARLGGEAQVATSRSSAARRWNASRNSAPLSKKLAGFTTRSRDVVLLGRETILRDGECGRLSHQRRLWLHGRQAHRLRLCAQRRTASPTTISAPAPTSSSSPRSIVQGRRIHLEPALRSRPMIRLTADARPQALPGVSRAMTFAPTATSAS